MLVWKINKIPVCEIDNQEAVRKAQLLMKLPLFLLKGKEAPCCCEIIFLHKEANDIELYLILHGEFDEKMGGTLEQQLYAYNYQYVRLNTSERTNLNMYLSSVMEGETYGVLKTEKIVTTPYTYEGYYYWADAMKHDEKKPYDNFDLLFQTLLNYSHSFVSFQLFPTTLGETEVDTMQRLSMFMESHMHSFPSQYGQMYEPYAEAPLRTYQHFVKEYHQPVFLFNLFAGSLYGGANYLAEQIMAMLKSQNAKTVDLQSVKLQSEYLKRYDYECLPFALNELLLNHYRDMGIWGGNIIPPNNLLRLPFLVTVDEALGFFHLPVDDGKIVGIASSSYEISNELLDENVTAADNIRFGTIVGKETCIGASLNDLSKHVLIVGMPGTGKTTFSLNLLLQFYRKGVPFLVVEPTKTEYRALIDAVPELQIFTPGNQEVSPFVINPFLPPKGIRIETYIPSLFDAFRAVFSMPSPLDTLFLKAIREAYIQYGWRDYSKLGDPEVKVFGMQEFIKVFKKVVSEMNYSKEIKGNIESGGVLRLSNLLEQNRNIFDTIHSVPIEHMLNKPTLIELNAIGNQEQKSLIMALLLIQACVHIKNNQLGDGVFKNVIMIDEAHVLLKPKSSTLENSPETQNSTIGYIENMIAEVRSYGTSVIIADQRPSAVGSAIVANTDMKIMFRLTENKERAIAGDSSSMTESMQKQLSQLAKGQAYVYYNRLLNPQLVQTPDIRKEENIRLSVLDDEVKQKNQYWKTHQELLKPYAECIHCKNSCCDFKTRANANYYMNLIWNAKHKEIVNGQKLLLLTNGIPLLLASYLEEYEDMYRGSLVICTRIMLLRKAELEKGITIGGKQKRELLESAEVRKGEEHGG